jgi:membrane protease YdiL (CAAX protease family)
VWLLAEYVLLFVALPVTYLFDLVPLPPIPALWIFASGCLVVLFAAGDFDRRRLWNTRKLRRRMVRAVLPFAVAAPVLVLLTAWIAPERLFALVRERPVLWAAIMVLYPLLSVYPQGVVYRAFIFHRYRPVFRSRLARILASAVAFSMVHVIFENWIAPVLTLIGGLLFAWTYARTRSQVVASFQHALFGCFLFTIGLGWYFYYAVVVG